MTDAEKIAALREAMQELLTVHEWLMKGVGMIAVPDYRLLNEAPIHAREALEVSRET